MATGLERLSNNSSYLVACENDHEMGDKRSQGDAVNNRKFERVFKLPDFQHVYTKHARHPLSALYTDEAHKFLVSHGVDSQLGPDMWNGFVRANSPELMSYIFVGTDATEFQWLCRFMGYTFAFDTKMDESEYKDSPDKSCATILGVTLVLLWNNPEDERLLEHLRPLYEFLTTEESRNLVKGFLEDLDHAKNHTKSLMEIKMVPLASAFRELWLEYSEAVPAEIVQREAFVLQDYYMACISEANNRKAGTKITSTANYIVFRRLSGGVLPNVICSDMLIARTEPPISHIPNSLFHGPEMQSLLLAISDIIGWHNDIFSFSKEVLLAGDFHNLVNVLCEERDCSSYTEAGVIALHLLQNRIAEMELGYKSLKAVASPEYHPAIDRYMSTCRDWISGTHQWHLLSPRYKIAGTSV